TAPQQAQRTKFSLAQEFTASMLTVITQLYWKQYAVKMSEYNAQIRANLNALSNSTDYPHLIVSKGNLESSPALDAVRLVDTVTLTWPDDIAGNGLATDLTVGVIYDVLNKFTYVNDLGTERHTGSLTIDVSSHAVTANLKAFVFF